MPEIVCPHCRQLCEIDPEASDSLLDCPHCDRSWRVPESAPSDLSPTYRPQAPAEVGLLSAGSLALLLTLLFYVLCVRPLGHVYAAEIFAERGWVPYVITFFSFWSGALLVGKYRRLVRQRRALELELLPCDLAQRITPENASTFLAHLGCLPAELVHAFLVERLRRGLDGFATRGNVSETLEQLRHQGDSDIGAMESSYTMLRTFIWAIPILGFIGTVIGIGSSVAGFSDAVARAADLEVVKSSIGTVTTGLGVAFDTTLLALVMSIFIMLPASSLQKAEEDFLARVDDYCRRHLVTRLDHGSEATRNEVAPRASGLHGLADELVSELLASLERRRGERR